MAIIFGGEDDEILIGTPDDDDMYGNGGNDRVEGRDGRDRIYGDAGDDQLFGQGGDDNFVGGTGDDLIDGGEGLRDSIHYENEFGLFGIILNMIPGFTASAADSFETYGTGQARDAFGDRDTLVGIEDIYTWDAADRLYGSSADNRFVTGGGRDLAYGMGGDDVLKGEAGNDDLDGGEGNDDLDGGSGDDALLPGAQATGFDTVLGGDGRDLLALNFSGLTAPLKGFYQRTGNSYSGQIGDSNSTRTVTYSGIERFSIYGTSFGDKIGGGDDDDWLSGQGGNDQLFGAGGADQIEGNEGDDEAFGGDGADWLKGDFGNDKLHGEAGADEIDGTYGSDTINGGAGDDKLWPGQNVSAGDRDQVNGGAGTDILAASLAGKISGSYSVDPSGGYSGQIQTENWTISYTSIERFFLSGGALADSIAGLDGDDQLHGGEGGSDLLIGGAGNDRLDPGREAVGNDEIRGGAGTDILSLNLASAETALSGFYSLDPAGGYSGQISAGGGRRTITYSGIERYFIVGTPYAEFDRRPRRRRRALRRWRQQLPGRRRRQRPARSGLGGGVLRRDGP